LRALEVGEGRLIEAKAAVGVHSIGAGEAVKEAHYLSMAEEARCFLLAVEELVEMKGEVKVARLMLELLLEVEVEAEYSMGQLHGIGEMTYLEMAEEEELGHDLG
jgi:hypothetical protein